MTKEESNILKGIGIVLMYIHHLFYQPANYEGMDIVFNIFSETQTVKLALACKVCVAVFVFVTAYGTTKSIRMRNYSDGRELSGYAVERYFKLMMNFWFIFIIAQSMSFLGNRYEIYGTDKLLRMKYMIIDFFGMSSLFGTPTLNATWWYMYMAVVLIFLVPVLYLIVKRIGYLAVPLVVMLPTMLGLDMARPICWYLLTAVIGVSLAQFECIEKIKQKIQKNGKFLNGIGLGIGSIIISLLLLRARMSAMNMIMISLYDGLITVGLMLISIFVINQIPIIRRLVILIGEHSMNMFMIHTFVKAYYFHDFSYGFKYSILILLVLLADTLLASVVLEWIKKKLGYNKLIAVVGKGSKSWIERLL